MIQSIVHTTMAVERQAFEREAGSDVSPGVVQEESEALGEVAVLASDIAGIAGLVADAVHLRCQAIEALQCRDEFVKLASHELRTPLTTLQLRVGWAARLVESGSLPDLPRLSEIFHIIERQIARLSQLCDELLDAADLTSGRPIEPRPDEVDLVELVRGVAARLSAQHGLSPGAIEVRAEGSVVGRWDRTHIEHAVINLMKNGITFGGGKLLTVGVAAVEGVARVTIVDHGRGIAKSDQERIFERFGRASAAANYGGLGLGLYIARALVTVLGGSIDVQSEPGAGSTFTIKLPAPALEQRS